MKFKCLCIFLTLTLLISCQSKQKAEEKKQEPAIKLTQIDALTMVSEIYDAYQNSEEYLVKGLFYPANFLSQDFILWGEAGDNYKTFNIEPESSDINNFWTISYEGIIKANKVLLVLDTMLADKIISEELATQLKSECYFNRGVFYFLLAQNFGNVPIVTNTDKAALINEPNSTQDAVFEYAISNFINAKSGLPFKYEDETDLGRATKGAALAYLGESYMWLKDYDKAILSFEELEGHYKLMSNFLDIHAFTFQNNPESIFEIQFKRNDNLGWGRDNYSTFIQSFAMPTEVGGAALAFINPKLAKSFENNDQRLRATVISTGQIHPDTSINISTYNSVQEKYHNINTLGTKQKPWLGEDGERSGYYSVKTWRAPDPNATATAVFSKANVILLRYGQVLLDLAACNYKIGHVKDAEKLINTVRARAGLKPIYKVAIQTILNEYRHELAGEYSLWYVLRRSGNHIAYIKSNFDIDIPKGHDILPIPAEQLRLNKSLIQNIGFVSSN